MSGQDTNALVKILSTASKITWFNKNCHYGYHRIHSNFLFNAVYTVYTLTFLFNAVMQFSRLAIKIDAKLSSSVRNIICEDYLSQSNE